MWPQLGFERQGEKPGRSKQRHLLTVWWRDHGHPALFSATESIGLLRVMLDLNVFLDIESSYNREGSLESKALAEDWLVDQIDLVISNELSLELARLPEGAEKIRQRKATARYSTVSTVAGAVEATAKHLIGHVARSQGINLALDPGDLSDVRHLAEASLSGVTVLTTRDEKFLEWSMRAIDVTGVRVMRPSDVIVHLDELARAQAYQPAQLQDTQYTLTHVRSGAESDLLRFLHDNQGEKMTRYLALTRQLLAQGPRWSRSILRDPSDNPIALYVTGVDEEELVVPLLRVNDPRLEETISHQLLFIIRKLARAEGRSVIRITDPNLADSMKRAIRDDGFIFHQEGWIGFMIAACAEAGIIDTHVTRAAELVKLQVPALRPNLSASVAAELERTLWPAKIVDSGLASFIVPIKPTWSAELFGIPQILMPRPNMLGISRVHVYYRSPRPGIVHAPARILWYASGARKHGGVGAIIACSRLEEVICAKPGTLHQRFRHFGVWRQEQITEVAQAGIAQALRFSGTEIFPRPVSFHRFQQLIGQKSRSHTLQSPLKISADLFAAVYKEGQGAHERSQ